MISFIISFVLCMPLLSVALLMVLTLDESRIQYNNELAGWNLEVVQFPFDKMIPAYKLHGAPDNL